jgi:predicted phosphate transport protein (TIGR00153 family)
VRWLGFFKQITQSKNKRFLELFIAHITNSVTCAKTLLQLFNRIEKAPTLLQEIIEFEHNGDQIARQVFVLLDETFIVAIDKEQLEILISELDDLVDGMRNAAEYVVAYEIMATRPEARVMAEKILEMTEKLKPFIEQLFTLSTAKLDELVTEVKRLEESVDAVRRDALNKFLKSQNIRERAQQGESASHLLALCREDAEWLAIFDELENVIDHGEDVANRVSSIVRSEGR